mgnify:FL=1
MKVLNEFVNEFAIFDLPKDGSDDDQEFQLGSDDTTDDGTNQSSDDVVWGVDPDGNKCRCDCKCPDDSEDDSLSSNPNIEVQDDTEASTSDTDSDDEDESGYKFF